MDPAQGSARAARDRGTTPDEDVRGENVRGEDVRDDDVRGEDVRDDDVRGEALRLQARLTVALDRLRDLLPRHAAGSPLSAGGGAPRAGVARFDDDDVDPALRELLGPAASRVSCLLEVAGSLADGTLTDVAAAEEAGRVADEQPHRRSR